MIGEKMKKRTSVQIFCDVIFALMLREFQTRFGSRRMGAFWTLFEPAVHVAIMLFIFAYIRARSLPGIEYAIFLIYGMLPFFLMRNLAKFLMNSVNANSALFAYPNIKIFDTYIARTIVEIMIFTTIFIIFIFVIGFWGHDDVHIAHPLGAIAYLLMGILFSVGFGIFLSCLLVEFPNLNTLISVFFMAIYFSCGVLFPIWIIPEPYLGYVMYNPYAQYINGIRESAITNYPEVSHMSLTYSLATMFLMLCLGISAYRLFKQRMLAK